MVSLEINWLICGIDGIQAPQACSIIRKILVYGVSHITVASARDSDHMIINGFILSSMAMWTDSWPVRIDAARWSLTRSLNLHSFIRRFVVVVSPCCLLCTYIGSHLQLLTPSTSDLPFRHFIHCFLLDTFLSDIFCLTFYWRTIFRLAFFV